MKQIQGGVTAAKGFEAAGVEAAIKYQNRKDMALIVSKAPCTVAGTFTSNVVKAAPVLWDKQIVEHSAFAQAVVVNEALVAVEERKQQMEEAYENIYARADLGKYAAAEDVVKLRKMMELTIKGLMNERILEDAFQPEMLYEEILEYLQLSRRLAERSGQPSDEEITEK